MLSDIVSNALMLAAVIVVAGIMDTIYIMVWRKRTLQCEDWFECYPKEGNLKGWVGAALFLAIVYIALHVAVGAGFQI